MKIILTLILLFIGNLCQSQQCFYATKHWPFYGPVLGPPDSNNSSSIQDQQILYIGMESPIIDISGSDFQINEFADNESYNVYIIQGEQNNGWSLNNLNWIFLSEAYGHEEFDISTTGITEVYWIKIEGIENSTGGCEIESVINLSDNTYADEHWPYYSPVIGPPDNNNSSSLQEGQILYIGFDEPITDISGNDFKINEYANNESYHVYIIAGQHNNSWGLKEQNWTYLSTGMGTTEFDISLTGINDIYWIKIEGIENSSGGCEIESVEVCDIVNNIEETHGTTINICPNIVSDLLQIDINSTFRSEYKISIYNLSGELLFQKEFIIVNSQTINLSSLNKGVYIIQIRGLKNQSFLNEKLIKI